VRGRPPGFRYGDRVRTKVALSVALCLIAVAVGYVVFSRAQRPSRAELTAELRADGAYVLADLSRVFGEPDDGGRRGFAVHNPLDVEPDSPGRVFDRVLRYRGTGEQVIGRVNHALSLRGYHTAITVIHSGEGTFGEAGNASGLHFSSVSGGPFERGDGNFRLTGYLPGGGCTAKRPDTCQALSLSGVRPRLPSR
jgi:hypothetical protein